MFSQDQENQAQSTPTMGIGIGAIGFYGDLNDKNYGSPLSGNPAYNLYFIQPITDYLDIRINFLKGEIREEERSIKRNVNFESEIIAGSAFLEYNFNHFLPADRTIMPFITAGVEVLSFNPKTDLNGFGGEPYNYWSDGSIRNVPENSSQASQSVIVGRDYNYETDIREVGYNPSNTYDENAFAIPVGIGVGMKLNDQFNFRLQSIMHLTFTDYIDGITPKSSREFVGDKRGNGNNDHFIVNSISLSYNFQKVPAADPFEKEEKLDDVDLLAYGNTEDYDGDGVIDLIDICANTPKGVSVDTLGCPVDSDKDGIPDYLDEEVNSRRPYLTNDQGVELTDEMILHSYMRFIDSTYEYVEVIERDFTKGGGKKSSKYRVKIKEFESGEMPEDMSELLSIQDLSKVEQGNRTIFTVGNYESIAEASKRANELSKQGYDNTEVLSRASNGLYIPTGRKGNAELSVTAPSETESENKGIVFRVQLGAFKNKPDAEAFNTIPNLFVFESNGVYRYMSGSYSDFNSAAKHKVAMIVKGYKDAFVVAFKNGERVSLKSLGIKTIDSNPIIGK